MLTLYEPKYEPKKKLNYVKPTDGANMEDVNKDEYEGKELNEEEVERLVKDADYDCETMQKNIWVDQEQLNEMRKEEKKEKREIKQEEIREYKAKLKAEGKEEPIEEEKPKKKRKKVK